MGAREGHAGKDIFVGTERGEAQEGTWEGGRPQLPAAGAVRWGEAAGGAGCRPLPMVLVSCGKDIVSCCKCCGKPLKRAHNLVFVLQRSLWLQKAGWGGHRKAGSLVRKPLPSSSREAWKDHSTRWQWRGDEVSEPFLV